MTTNTTEQHTTSGSEHYQGRVKWFNNKAGYGFITVTGGSSFDGDVFVHHSSLSVSEEQYKYLVQGEYVEFELSRVDGGQHEWQASNVRGCNGGKLMCETRREVRSARTSHSARSDDDHDYHATSGRNSYASVARRSEDASGEARPTRRARPSASDSRPRHSQDDVRSERHAPVRYAGQGPRGDGVEWMLVRRNPPRSSQQQPRQQRSRPRPRQQPSEQSEQV